MMDAGGSLWIGVGSPVLLIICPGAFYPLVIPWSKELLVSKSDCSSFA